MLKSFQLAHHSSDTDFLTVGRRTYPLTCSRRTALHRSNPLLPRHRISTHDNPALSSERSSAANATDAILRPTKRSPRETHLRYTSIGQRLEHLEGRRRVLGEMGHGERKRCGLPVPMRYRYCRCRRKGRQLYTGVGGGGGRLHHSLRTRIEDGMDVMAVVLARESRSCFAAHFLAFCSDLGMHWERRECCASITCS